MANANTGSSTPSPPQGRRTRGTGGFQFSLTSLFVFITAMALILSAHFSVGRWMGMSTEEVVREGLLRLLITTPTLLVWLVGMSVAIGRLKRNRLPAILTLIALGTLLLGIVALNVAQMAVIHAILNIQLRPGWANWAFYAPTLLHEVLHVASWIVILVAVFVQRTPDAPAETPIDPGERW